MIISRRAIRSAEKGGALYLLPYSICCYRHHEDVVRKYPLGERYCERNGRDSPISSAQLSVLTRFAFLFPFMDSQHLSGCEAVLNDKREASSYFIDLSSSSSAYLSLYRLYKSTRPHLAFLYGVHLLGCCTLCLPVSCWLWEMATPSERGI